jgi:methylated-DNA-protein-cysteine methyltransferase-like protein
MTTVRPKTPAAEAEERIRATIERVPRGRVATYGGIAHVAGLPGRARLVGTVLGKSPAGSRLPWHRIINAAGRISFPEGSTAYQRQQSKLKAEGVRVVKGRVDLKGFGWPRPDDEGEDLDAALWGPKGTLNMRRVGRKRRTGE